MRSLFTLFGLLSVLSVLLLGASVFTETLSGYKNFVFAGSTMTINFSGVDRILLGLAIVSIILTAYFWSRLSGRR